MARVVDLKTYIKSRAIFSIVQIQMSEFHRCVSLLESDAVDADTRPKSKAHHKYLWLPLHPARLE